MIEWSGSTIKKKKRKIRDDFISSVVPKVMEEEFSGIPKAPRLKGRLFFCLLVFSVEVEAIDEDWDW